MCIVQEIMYFIEICSAGYHSLENTDCSKCAVDTYKASHGSSKCIACPDKTTTAGKTGQNACGGKTGVK